MLLGAVGQGSLQSVLPLRAIVVSTLFFAEMRQISYDGFVSDVFAIDYATGGLPLTAASSARVVTTVTLVLKTDGWLESLFARLAEDVAAVGPMSDNIGGDQFAGHLLGERRPPLDELAGILASEF